MPKSMLLASNRTKLVVQMSTMQMHGFPLGTVGRLLIEARIMPGLQARTHAMHILFDMRGAAGAAARPIELPPDCG
jgi:hypothetical protein